MGARVGCVFAEKWPERIERMEEGLAEAARLLPGGRLETIEGAGHLVHRTFLEEYKELLGKFLLENVMENGS